MQPLSSFADLPYAAITRYYGATPGLVIYLHLWKTVADILVFPVSFIHIIHDR